MSSENNNWQNTEFTQQQWQVFQTLIEDVQNNVQSKSQESAESSDSVEPFDNDDDVKWNAQKTDFFDSWYEEKNAIIDNSIEHSNKNTYFRNVHLYIERIKDMTILKDADVIRANLYSCMREHALRWYTEVVNDDQKRLIKLEEDVEKWERLLLKRWKKSSFTTLTVITKKKYTMKNARKHREFFDFVEIIVREVKSIMMSIYSQLYLIYNELKLKFRRDLTKSTKNTIMNEFLQQLDDKKEIWWNIENKYRFYHQFVDDRRPQLSYRSQALASSDSYNTSFSIHERVDYENLNEFLSQSRQTQYSTSYQFEKQNSAYTFQQQQRSYQSNYSNRQSSSQNMQERSYANQQYRSQSTQQDSAQGNRNTFDSQSQYSQSLRLSNYSADSSNLFSFSSKQDTYSNQNEAFNQAEASYRRAYFANEKAKNSYSNDEKNYQNDHNVDTKNASKISVINDEYHDEEHFETQKSNENYVTQKSLEYFVNTSAKQTKVYSCRRCQIEFYSNNKLHRHLRSCQVISAKFDTSLTKNTLNYQISTIQFIVKVDTRLSLEFRSWRYVTMKTNIEQFLTNMCVDIECEASLIDRKFLMQKIFDYKTHARLSSKSLKIRNIGDAVVITIDYIFLIFRISGIATNDKNAIATFTRRIYIVKKLKTKILMSNDILESKQISIDVNKQIVTIESCKNIKVQLNVTNADSQIKRVVRVSETIKISVKSATTISFKLRDQNSLSTERDFMFISSRIERLNQDEDVLSHIIDAHIEMIQVHNINSKDVYILKNTRLELVQKYEEEECYLANAEYAHLTANAHKSASRNWFKQTMKMSVSAMTADATMTINYENLHNANATNFVAHEVNAINSAINSSNSIASSANVNLKEVLSTDITIYDDVSTRTKFANVTTSYSELWNDNEFIVRISKNEWMSIELKSDAKIETAKMYSLSLADRKFVDEIFDKLHAQERMKYTTQSTSHEYSVFAVWRTVSESNDSERKERVVVNIRDLNKIIFTDSYFMSLQFDIIAAMTECRFISIFDVVDFFHQWLVKLADRHKLTVVSHREQEQFNVVVMKFKNSLSYVQRRIDAIFRDLRDFVRAYVDDIVVFFNTFEKHMTHLHSMFQRLNFYDISLFLKKFFLDYSTVALLDQKVDVFDLTIAVDKLKIIIKLNFSYILKDLKIYLNFTKWLREFVTFYAQKTDALQRRKTLLLRQSSFNKRTIRKIYSKKTMINHFSVEKLESYRLLQKDFSKTSFLVHFSSNRQLYIDIDVFKRREFEAMIYHLKVDVNFDKFKRNDIELILFLSRMLNETETKYWFTELEMCDLVWIVRKIRHMIETIKSIIVVFTNHVVNTFIAKQTTMNSNNTDKLNLRLVRAFVYLSQFRLKMKYKSEKNHVVSNALSRLTSDNEQIDKSSEDRLDLNTYHEKIIDPSNNFDCYALQETLIAMSKNLKKEIKNEYQREKTWRNMIEMLKSLTIRMQKKKLNLFARNSQISSSIEDIVSERNVDDQKDENTKLISKKLRTEINFALNTNDIIYHVDLETRRSCISVAVKREIFRLVHDKNQHSEVHRCYDRIVNTMYISRLSRKIKKYIEHCSTCQLAQTKRHRPYEELMFITFSSRSFHIIVIDFILAMSDEMNTVMSATCKHSRRISLILDKKTYEAKKWINALLDRLLIADWRIFETIMFDRDSKFMFDLWQIFFIRLNTRLLIVVTYHSQTNEVSERTNQTIEIAIRYFVIEFLEIDYILILSIIQTQLNNSSNVVTDLSSNEIIYDFKVRDALFSIIETNTVDTLNLSAQRMKYQREAVDATDFVVAKVKVYYDARHTSILLRSGEKTYLQLNKSYKLLGKLNSKLSQQRCESFKILERVERLAYRLELSSAWRIHSVVSIAQLESTSVEADFYERSRFHYFDFIEIEDDTNQYKSYEIEKLVDKRIRRYNKILVTQYLVRWIDYESKFDEWRSISKLQNFQNLIEQYEAVNSENSDIRDRDRKTRTK